MLVHVHPLRPRSRAVTDIGLETPNSYKDTFGAHPSKGDVNFVSARSNSRPTPDSVDSLRTPPHERTLRPLPFLLFAGHWAYYALETRISPTELRTGGSPRNLPSQRVQPDRKRVLLRHRARPPRPGALEGGVLRRRRPTRPVPARLRPLPRWIRHFVLDSQPPSKPDPASPSVTTSPFAATTSPFAASVPATTAANVAVAIAASNTAAIFASVITAAKSVATAFAAALQPIPTAVATASHPAVRVHFVHAIRQPDDGPSVLPRARDGP